MLILEIRCYPCTGACSFPVLSMRTEQISKYACYFQEYTKKKLCNSQKISEWETLRPVTLRP